jgi:hypothetical protein
MKHSGDPATIKLANKVNSPKNIALHPSEKGGGVVRQVADTFLNLKDKILPSASKEV